VPAAPIKPHTLDQPADEDFTEHVVQKSSGEVFGHCVVEDDPHGRTHKCKNMVHFWEGTKADFEKEFREATRAESSKSQVAPDSSSTSEDEGSD
jgi:hypothetical protein